jgi:hypothetical protein
MVQIEELPYKIINWLEELGYNDIGICEMDLSPRKPIDLDSVQEYVF